MPSTASSLVPPDRPRYSGRCFCGAVEISISGAPVAMGYCHCESCRHWSAGPLNAFTLWKPEVVEVIRGAERIASFAKTPSSHRKWCTVCGGHLFTEHPALGVTDVYAAVLSDLDFVPALHVHYEQTQLRMHDGLPKLKDLPAEMGGTGIAMAP